MTRACTRAANVDSNGPVDRRHRAPRAQFVSDHALAT